MKNFRFSLIALLFLVGTLGMAFALFTFVEDGAIDQNLGLKVEDYVEFGELESSVKYLVEGVEDLTLSGIVIDNETDQAKYAAEVTLTHIYDEDSVISFEDVYYENAIIKAVFNEAFLDEYFTIELTYADWEDQDTQAQLVVTVTLVWLEDAVLTSPEDYADFVANFDANKALADIITLSVTLELAD